MADLMKIEYRIVPAVRNGDIKHIKRDTKNNKFSKRIPVSLESDNKIYSLQPMFKAPKSTRDVNSVEESNKDDATIRQVSEKNGCGEKFNHFTMSRRGPVRSPETQMNSDSEVIRRKSATSIRATPIKNGDALPDIQTSETEKSTHLKVVECRDFRRTSAGDETLSVSPQPRGRRSVPNISVTSATKYNESKSQGASPRRTCQPGDQSRSQTNARLSVQFAITSGYDEPRRKSLHDGRASQPWYSPERRPVSSDRCERSRRNVISPTTLSRLSFNPQGIEERGGSASLSVCTEDDWKNYGSNFPNRRLVSHKKLNHKCRLPYNDNIGLEETVTSDQAKKAAKMKQYKEWRKHYKPSQQTPKQVWHRTVRSILAANQLYHQVQRRNRNRCQ